MLQELFPFKDPEALAALMKAAWDVGATAGGNVIKFIAVLTPVSIEYSLMPSCAVVP